MPRLRRVDCSMPGIRRRRAGRGFYYVYPDGARVTDGEVVDRIRALVIPPAWDDVWICPLPNGHLQAVGTDARGRRQYLYHETWRRRRDREKFDHMLEFARTLPALRRHCADALAGDELDPPRVLACAVRLLDLGFFRIGSEGYVEENETYGLASLEKRHAQVDGDMVTFDYTAKFGKRRLQTLVDPEVAEVVSALKARRAGGKRLLAAQVDGRWRPLGSADINAHIKALTGGDFTAKEFRTWNATVLAAVALAVSTPARSATGRKRAVTRAMKEVAHYLGNTPAVARASYVDPRVVDLYLHDMTIQPSLHRLGEGASYGQLSTQGGIERAVIDLLTDADETESRAA